ncbi:MAG: AbrB/MazE/SpoVT family DNA-binding domain-containing protein [bacterium]|nr:AbrB/MazE/SpoVT family DNA-binding domain-containing protein [bacterium]
MSTKVTKWGNSLALRIPHEIAKKYRLIDGAKVTFTEMQKGVFLTAVQEDKHKLPTLREAMANFVPEMMERVNWGRDVGKEILE